MVKLIDQLPPEHPEAGDDSAKRPLGGQQMLVRGEVMRGRGSCGGR